MARIPRIHSPEPLVAGTEVPLSATAAVHLQRVLRLSPDAALTLFDGRGGEYRARLSRMDRGGVHAAVLEHLPIERESSLRVTLGQGISRGERMDYVIQKAVELGVAAVQPLLSARCVVQLKGERQARRLAHWRGIAIAACEQCGRNTVPEIAAPLALSDWLAEADETPGLLLDPDAERSVADLSLSGGAVRLLVGPEGGLTEAECKAARQAGFIGLRLGPRVLRTETAPVAALAALQALWGDLR